MSGMGGDRSLVVGEQSVELLHPHWKTLVGPVLTGIVIVAALLVAEVLIPSGRDAAVERLAAAVVAIVVLMWGLTFPVLRWRTTRYELTTRRMRLRTGVIARTGSDIPLSRITDVSFRKSPLDRLLGCGTLVVESAGEHAEIVLPKVPHVERVSATLFQLVEDERLRAATTVQDDRRPDLR
jgi:membrane protein YdbS with pleckstrin-like domain